jgi:hypothetical protein
VGGALVRESGDVGERRAECFVRACVCLCLCLCLCLFLCLCLCLCLCVCKFWVGWEQRHDKSGALFLSLPPVLISSDL